MERILLSASRRGCSMTALALTLLLTPLALAESDTPSQSDAEAAPFQGGWTAWLDPVTGKLLQEKPSAGVVLPLDNQSMRRFSTSNADLIGEEMPDGTVTINLQGRFHQGSVATLDDAGDLHIQRIGGEIFTSPDGREISNRLHNSDKPSGGNEP